MGRPYSQDLRERVIASVDLGGRVYAIAPVFQVSVSYIYKALGRRRATGVPRDNQGETAASIRMRMRRGWTAVARA